LFGSSNKCANPAAIATVVNKMLSKKNVFVAIRPSTLRSAGLREKAGYRDFLTIKATSFIGGWFCITRKLSGAVYRVGSRLWCTPSMGANSWGASPLDVNRRMLLGRLRQVLAEGNGGRVTDRGEEAGAQPGEPTTRHRRYGQRAG
jgi:hypothetical protein